jgi:hypothetical protein
MQCCFDPQDKLDEIAVVFAWNFYAILSAGADRLKDLAPLYADESVRLKLVGHLHFHCLHLTAMQEGRYWALIL